MIQKILWLSLAGACGTVSRYALYEAAAKIRSCNFPLGTLIVNILGSFLFGVIYATAERKLNLSSEVKLIMLTGLIGAFTTFSTFAFETAKMLRNGQWLFAFSNALVQVALGVGALAFGVLLGRKAL